MDENQATSSSGKRFFGIGNVVVDTAGGGGFNQPVSLKMGLSWLTVVVYMLIFAIAQVVGFACALIQPRRGLQDLLAGTYLVRR